MDSFIPKKMAQYVAMQYLYIYIYAYIGFDPSHICNFDSCILVLMGLFCSNLWGNAHKSRRPADSDVVTSTTLAQSFRVRTDEGLAFDFCENWVLSDCVMNGRFYIYIY